MQRRVKVKPNVILSPQHWAVPEVGRIITAMATVFPADYPLVITRGCEECKGGKRHSKHLPPYYSAFDFRVKHLPADIDCQLIVRRLQRGLGPEYYVYLGEVDSDGKIIRWIHVQWNGGA